MFDFYPEKTYSRMEVMSKPTPVPAVNGVYFWWFKKIPPGVPTEGCITAEGYTLLYVGISPDKRGKPNSRSNLRQRIRTHYSGNAAGSTLRRTLGVLLSGESSFPLRRVGSGSRMTFTHPGEQWLDLWMEQNARVHWIPAEAPWELEDKLIASIPLPLNIQGNIHKFKPTLSGMRSQAAAEARLMDIADERGLRRRLTAQ
ncbi:MULTISPECIES: GIY-YIG nuclease family protein [unclassified Cedecea]|uniref:GIY-YIG nuclease family protein n=1 Tax=unclassified Cedecea TaxID=2649846 RepID=UPI00301960D0